jgi:hypothetical protein
MFMIYTILYYILNMDTIFLCMKHMQIIIISKNYKKKKKHKDRTIDVYNYQSNEYNSLLI